MCTSPPPVTPTPLTFPHMCVRLLSDNTVALVPLDWAAGLRQELRPRSCRPPRQVRFGLGYLHSLLLRHTVLVTAS